MITPGLYAIPLGIVNAYLLEGDGLTLIDTGVPGSAPRILEALSALGKAPEDVGHILVTHCHADHSGSLATLKEATRARIAMHPLDAALVQQGQAMRPVRPAPGLFYRLLVPLVVSGRSAPSTIEACEVDFPIEDGDELDFAGGLQAIHTPGHTAGHLAFYWPRSGGVLLAADAAANFIRLGYTPIYEDFPEAQQSLAALARLDFEIACFGHGRPILHAAAQRFRQQWGVP